MDTLHERLFHEESAGQFVLSILFHDSDHDADKHHCVFAPRANGEIGFQCVVRHSAIARVRCCRGRRGTQRLVPSMKSLGVDIAEARIGSQALPRRVPHRNRQRGDLGRIKKRRA